MNEVAADLTTALNILERRGWCQKDMETKDGRVCVVGALRIAICGTARYPAVQEGIPLDKSVRFHKARYALHAFLGQAPTIWNDAKDRTYNQVRQALRGAAQAQPNVDS